MNRISRAYQSSVLGENKIEQEGRQIGQFPRPEFFAPNSGKQRVVPVKVSELFAPPGSCRREPFAICEPRRGLTHQENGGGDLTLQHVSRVPGAYNQIRKAEPALRGR